MRVERERKADVKLKNNECTKGEREKLLFCLRKRKSIRTRLMR
jgi:hypothetical protein